MTSGLYYNTFVNDGTLRLRGGAGQTNTVRLDADVSGAGTIVLDGGNASSFARTLLITTGDVEGQTVVLRNAAWTAYDARGYARVGSYDAQGNFISDRKSVV